MERQDSKGPTKQVLAAGNDSSSLSSPARDASELTGVKDGPGAQASAVDVEEIDESKKGWFAYFRTRNFYIVLVLGYSLCILMQASH